jgi:hypothetical protein
MASPENHYSRELIRGSNGWLPICLSQFPAPDSFPVLVVVSCLQQNKQGFQIYYTNILNNTRKRLHHFMNDDLYQVKKIR